MMKCCCTEKDVNALTANTTAATTCMSKLFHQNKDNVLR